MGLEQHMKNFGRSLLIQVLALVLFVVGSFVLLFLMAFIFHANKKVVTPNSILVLDLSTSFSESCRGDGSPGPAELMHGSVRKTRVLPLSGVLQALERASHDNSISALYLTGNIVHHNYGSGPAALKELHDAILKFKTDSGKPVIAYNQDWTMWDYYLCSCASKLYLNPSGSLDCAGIATESTFFAGALKKYGVGVQVTRAGRYKSAMESYLLERMSPADREQTSGYIGDIWNDWKDVIAADRKLTSVGIQTMSDTRGFLGASEALNAGLVDELASTDQILDELKTLTGRKPSDLDFPKVKMADYMRTAVFSGSKNKIALVVAEGEIVSGNGSDSQVGGDRLSRELRELRLDPQVKAIVLRVNSPGGGSLASDLIKREIILAREKKPVVVSMGHLAASGGYMISTYGHRIFAEPNTITGSIGVFGFFPNIQKLAKKHGVTWDGIKTSKLSGMFTRTRPRSVVELARIQELVDDNYDQFLDDVSASRNISKEQVHDIAQGRVWSGRQALNVGLVDELGGMRDAINYAAKMAKIDGDYSINMFTEPRTPLDDIVGLLSDEDDALSESKGGVFEEVYSYFASFLDNVQALNDPRGIYARMPFDAHFR